MNQRMEVVNIKRVLDEKMEAGMNKYLFFRAVVWFICIYNVLLGIIFNCPESIVINFTKTVLSYDGTTSTAMMFTVKLLGVYMIFFGAAMGLAAWNPVKNRAILTVGAIFLVLRALQRVLQADQLQTAFGITPERNWMFIGLLVFFAVAVLVFRLKLQAELKNSAQS